MDSRVEILPMGPSAVLVSVADRSPVALAAAISAEFHSSVGDVVPAARNVLVRFSEPLQAMPELIARLRLVAASDEQLESAAVGSEVQIPVRYDGEDLVEVAAELGMTVDEVVERHHSVVHRALFCGFAPGFAYLELSDPKLEIPRRVTPRSRVPAGSVAVAAGYTAVYPNESPGGWHLIGRTEIQLWDPSRRSPSLIEPGDLVRFVPR